MRHFHLVLVGVLSAALGLAALAATPPNLDRALEAQEQMVRDNPADAQAVNDLANLLLLADRTERAEELYRDALDLDPSLVSAHYNLALLLQQRGALGPALEHFGQVVELDPANAWAHYQIGAIQQSRNRKTKALDSYSRAFALDPDLAFPEVNPQVLDNRYLTEALLLAHRGSATMPLAPKAYEEPNRIIGLMVPMEEAEGETGEETPAPDGETGGAPGAATDAAAETMVRPGTVGAPGSPGGSAGSLPRAGDEPPAVEPERDGTGRRVLRPSDLEGSRVNQAPPTGQVYTPPSGGVRQLPRSGAPTPPPTRPRYQPPRPPAQQQQLQQQQGTTSPRYRPGVQSTGRLDIELGPAIGPATPVDILADAASPDAPAGR